MVCMDNALEHRSDTSEEVRKRVPQVIKTSSSQVDPKEERKLLIKLDCWIGITIGILFLLSFLDRSNLGNAYSTASFKEELKLPPNGINVVTSIFYGPYVLFELPSALIYKKIGARKVIPAITVGWGIVTLCTGFVNNYAGLIVTRLFLGAVESGFFPILSVYLTEFYKRSELGLRTSYLFVSAALSGAFGGLIATGVFQGLDGRYGVSGWRWLYHIEGAITIGFGVLSYFILADSFESAWYLNKRDKELMRIRAQASKAFSQENEVFSKEEIKLGLTDPKNYIAGLSQFCADTGLFALSTFLPVIIRSNFQTASTIKIQLLTVPVYIFASVTYIALAAITDRIGRRAFFLMGSSLSACVGFAILISYPGNTGALYFATFLAAAGVYISVGLNVSFLNINNANALKRATGAGMLLSLGNSGGIVSGQIYRSEDQPRYILGHGVLLGFLLIATLGYLTSYLYYSGMNHSRDKVQAQDSTEHESDFSHPDKVRSGLLRVGHGAHQGKGDREMSFRYAL